MSKNCRILVSNLPADVLESELDRIFGKWGNMISIEIEETGRKATAIIDFQYERDAEDAVHYSDNIYLGDAKLHVELFKPKKVKKKKVPKTSLSIHRILVRELPKGTSTHSLEALMKAAGRVVKVRKFENTTSAHVEFERAEDVRRAIRMFHMTEFTNKKGVTSEIRVRGCKALSKTINNKTATNANTEPLGIRKTSRPASRISSPTRYTPSPSQVLTIRRSNSRSQSPMDTTLDSPSTSDDRRKQRNSTEYQTFETQPVQSSRAYTPPPPKQQKFRVFVEGFPATATCQDVQNRFRDFGGVVEAMEMGIAILRFEKYKNMKKAIRRMDETKFVTAKGETARIQLREDKPLDARGRRCRSRSYSHSRSPSPIYDLRLSRDSDDAF